MEMFYIECEKTIKQYATKYLDNYISDIQKKLLSTKSYLDDSIQTLKDINSIFDKLTNKILNDLLNKTHYESVSIDETESVFIPCTKRINHILINYYKKRLSEFISFIPSIDTSLANEIDYINDLNNIYDGIVDQNAFTKDIDDLRRIDELEPFVSDCINYDIREFIQ